MFSHHYKLQTTKIYFICAVSIMIVSVTAGSIMLHYDVSVTSLIRLYQGAVAAERHVSVFDYTSYYQQYPKDFSLEGPLYIPEYRSSELTLPLRNALSVPVLLYHGVVAHPDGVNVTYDVFKDQLLSLKQAGYRTIGIHDFYSFMRGELSVPEKTFLITFDDGRKDSVYPVDHLLRALDYRAVMFSITGSTVDGHPYYVSWNEFRRMYETGRWDVQSHGRFDHDLIATDERQSAGHFLSNKQWLSLSGRLETDEEYTRRIQGDLILSREIIAKTLGTYVLGYAFPFGDFGEGTPLQQTIFNSVSDIYALSFYQIWNHAEFNYPQPGVNGAVMIKRITPQPNWSGEDLLAYLEPAKAKRLPYSAQQNNFLGWNTTWGSSRALNNTLVLNATPGTTGFTALLTGSEYWKNYSLSADVRLKHGENVSLFARYRDNKNYFACTFSNKSVTLKAQEAGNVRVYDSKKIDLSHITRYQTRIGIAAHGGTVYCLIDAESVLDTEVPTKYFQQGSVGISAWHPQENNVELIVTDITVNTKQPARIAP